VSDFAINDSDVTTYVGTAPSGADWYIYHDKNLARDRAAQLTKQRAQLARLWAELTDAQLAQLVASSREDSTLGIAAVDEANRRQRLAREVK
jgi:hypothetical protein